MFFKSLEYNFRVLMPAPHITKQSIYGGHDEKDNISSIIEEKCLKDFYSLVDVLKEKYLNNV